jgi:hypothetical protein
MNSRCDLESAGFSPIVQRPYPRSAWSGVSARSSLDPLVKDLNFLWVMVWRESPSLILGVYIPCAFHPDGTAEQPMGSGGGNTRWGTPPEGSALNLTAGLTPIKLNTVLQRSTWKQEVPQLLDFAAGTGLEIRFIELMRTGTERAWCESEFISVDEVCKGLSAEILPADEQSPAPARRTLVNWRGALVKVGWITPRSHPFCAPTPAGHLGCTPASTRRSPLSNTGTVRTSSTHDSGRRSPCPGC